MMSPMLHLFWHFYWANRVDFKFPGLHWSTVNGDRWLLRLSRKATPMLCFAHGGSEGCEQQNREQGTHCPKCSNNQQAVEECPEHSFMEQTHADMAAEFKHLAERFAALSQATTLLENPGQLKAADKKTIRCP